MVGRTGLRDGYLFLRRVFPESLARERSVFFLDLRAATRCVKKSDSLWFLQKASVITLDKN
jgi:hypothetical protein